MDETVGTFLVRNADDATAELVAVENGRVVVLSSNPGLERDDVVVGTISANPPLGVSWSLVDVERRYQLAIEAVDEPPGELGKRLAASVPTGEMARARIDGGELHVLRVPPAETRATVADIVADEATRRRAARLGSRRAEVRGANGVVGVRYLEE